MYDFFRGKKIFITGHTGFKGTWLSKILINFGAEVTGYSLNPSSGESLFFISGVEKNMNSIIGDIRDFVLLEKTFKEFEPEIVIHLAAQPIVRESYNDPRYTYETNVMGTVNILECIRKSGCVKSFLNVTTDKVYKNNEWEWGYREYEPLDGYDPYSNSKSCSELVTNSYKNSFFTNENISISTARAGNVIGGGDFSNDRIIPDCIRAAVKKTNIIIRNPNSIRPYQHVLDPLCAYLLITLNQYEDIKYAGCYNVGPDECDCVTNGTLADLFCESWGEGLTWISRYDNGPHEANYLKLDCSKIKAVFGWSALWHIQKAINETVEWTKVYLNNDDVVKVMDKQIYEYFKLFTDLRRNGKDCR